jgi:hypothetical protein
VTVRRGRRRRAWRRWPRPCARAATAIGRLEGELDALLATLRDPPRSTDDAAADRLRFAVRAAGVALSRAQDLIAIPGASRVRTRPARMAA